MKPLRTDDYKILWPACKICGNEYPWPEDLTGDRPEICSSCFKKANGAFRKAKTLKPKWPPKAGVKK